MQIHGQVIVAGAARGEALISGVPLSFWGGVDPDTGEIIDRRHPLAGQCATGRVLIIPAGRGSCSGSGVLLEAIRNGTAPAAIVTTRIDPIISLGAILGQELYGTSPSIVVISALDGERFRDGDVVVVDASGSLTVER